MVIMTKAEILRKCEISYYADEAPNLYKKLDLILEIFFKNVSGIKKMDRKWSIERDVADEIIWHYKNFKKPFSKAVRNVYKHLTHEEWEEIIKEQFGVECIDDFYSNKDNKKEIGYALLTISRLQELPEFIQARS